MLQSNLQLCLSNQANSSTIIQQIQQQLNQLQEKDEDSSSLFFKGLFQDHQRSKSLASQRQRQQQHDQQQQSYQSKLTCKISPIKCFSQFSSKLSSKLPKSSSQSQFHCNNSKPERLSANNNSYVQDLSNTTMALPQHDESVSIHEKSKVQHVALYLFDKTNDDEPHQQQKSEPESFELPRELLNKNQSKGLRNVKAFRTEINSRFNSKSPSDKLEISKKSRTRLQKQRKSQKPNIFEEIIEDFNQQEEELNKLDHFSYFSKIYNAQKSYKVMRKVFNWFRFNQVYSKQRKLKLLHTLQKSAIIRQRQGMLIWSIQTQKYSQMVEILRKARERTNKNLIYLRFKHNCLFQKTTRQRLRLALRFDNQQTFLKGFQFWRKQFTKLKILRLLGIKPVINQKQAEQQQHHGMPVGQIHQKIQQIKDKLSDPQKPVNYLFLKNQLARFTYQKNLITQCLSEWKRTSQRRIKAIKSLNLTLSYLDFKKDCEKLFSFMKRIKENQLFYQQIKYMREVKSFKKIENIIVKKPLKQQQQQQILISPFKVIASRSPMQKRTTLRGQFDIKNKALLSKSPQHERFAKSPVSNSRDKNIQQILQLYKDEVEIKRIKQKYFKIRSLQNQSKENQNLQGEQVKEDIIKKIFNRDAKVAAKQTRIPQSNNSNNKLGFKTCLLEYKENQRQLNR